MKIQLHSLIQDESAQLVEKESKLEALEANYKKAVEEAKSIEFDKVLEVLTSSNFYADVVTGRITFAANGNAVKPAVVMTFENKNYKYYTTVE